MRIAGREDVSTIFTFPVANTGAAASSRVITAPPYTLIVFTDPAQPNAGAPISIFVVLVDQNGNPVTGKPLRGTFSGPGQQAPIDAKEDAATLGPGRYQIAVPSLDAGKWTVTIGIGTDASGAYSFDVSR